jgi:hypothetical protein
MKIYDVEEVKFHRSLILAGSRGKYLHYIWPALCTWEGARGSHWIRLGQIYGEE